MDIVIPRYITREFIQDHQSWNFVYPTNAVHNHRVGPSAICADLSNCFGVSVRWRLCRSSGFFQDAQRDVIIPQIDRDIAAIPRDKPIILFPKIGSGHSLMYKFAPICFEHLTKELAKIAAKYRWDYTFR